MYKKLILFYFSTFLLFLAPSVQAQSMELSITPALVRANIKPGKTITQAFNISYSGARPKTFIAKIIPFKSDDNTNIPILLWDAKPVWVSYFSLANSAIALNKPFTLLPGQKDQLVISIKIPEEQRESEIYTTLVFVSEQLDSADNSQAVGGIGANMIVSITNSYPPKSQISIKTFEPKTKPLAFIADYYIFDNLKPIQFSAKAENSGSHAGLISGQFQINIAGIKHQQTLESSNILSGSQKQLLASGGGQLILTPHINNIGASDVSINVETETSKTSATFKIILIPFKAGLGLVVVLTLTYFILKKTKKQPIK